MANTVRSAKSSSEWGQTELHAYNIVVQREEDMTTFFGIDNLPLPAVDPKILHMEDVPEVLDDSNVRNIRFVRYLDHTLEPPPSPSSEESPVIEFAVELFRRNGYENRNRMARMRKDLRLFICGQWTPGEADVALVDAEPIYGLLRLIVQEDRRPRGDPRDPVSQLIAKAIAAFHYNNKIREALGQTVLEHDIVPGIVFNRSTPTFYKIPVTADLVRHVAQGTYPSQATVVAEYAPNLPAGDADGMKPLDNRRLLLSYFEAFRRVIGI